MSEKPRPLEGERPPRTARLVLITRSGVLIGCLPPIPVETPYWQDIQPVVKSAKSRFGIDLTILRLLDTEILGSIGGEVTYLAESLTSLDESVLPLEPWPRELEDQPLRLPYARPGGPSKDLAWAAQILRRLGHEIVGSPVQVRTWNLSSIWCIPVVGQGVWLKVVPPFFGHEGALIERMASQAVPKLIGFDARRTLFAEVPGNDLYVADLPTQLAMVELLVGIQSDWMGGVEQLVNLGLPDWRGHTLQGELASLIEFKADEIPPADLPALERFVAGLPSRRAEIAECGIPDTLVHGDFHPGNVRGDGKTLTLIDWADSGIGHPLLDQSAFLERVPDGDVATVQDHWANLWREVHPGCNPEWAAQLIRPIATAQRAIKYQMFLDNIEPSERVYHCSDPADWLRETVSELTRAAAENPD